MSDLDEGRIRSPVDRSKYRVMEEMLDDITVIMEDLCQSGFQTVHDATLQGLKKAKEQAGQYGMTYLAGLLADFYDEISAGRHQMQVRTERMAELYTKISEYLYLCRQKNEYNQMLDYYR